MPTLDTSKLTTNTSISTNVAQTVAPTAPIRGTFGLTFNGTQIRANDGGATPTAALRYNIEDWRLRQAIANSLNWEDVTVSFNGRYSDGGFYIIDFKSTTIKGDLPLF